MCACYRPARVSNFVKDFLAGAYDQTSKESIHVFGFCFLDGVAMLLFGVLNVQGHTIKRGKWFEKKGYYPVLGNQNTEAQTLLE